jgi:hypothetical protein
MQGTTNERKEIIEEIEHAFANITYPGDDRLVINPSHYEADDVIQDFKGKRWEEITLELAYKHRLSLPLFTSEAFCFYLPGLLVAALRAPAESKQNPGEILELIFYSLIPLKDESDDTARLFDRIKCFTPQQKASLGKFVRFFIQTNPNLNELYGDAASELWKV